MRLAALALIALPALAAIDGTVVNKTSGMPAANTSVALIRPGQNGMAPVGSTTTDATGHFHFDNAAPVGGPQLLQAVANGVNYNLLLTPNMPTGNVELPIYDATPSPSSVKVVERMLIFEPNTAQIRMNETVILRNNANRTFHNAQGGDFLFYVPPAANGQVKVMAQGPSGMALPRAAERTSVADIYKLNFPVKPGETQLEITYTLPAGSPFLYHGRVVNVKGMEVTPLRLIAPQGVNLESKDVEKVGTEPKTQATVYTVTARDLFSVNVTGTGSGLTNDGSAASDAESGADPNDSPQVTEGQPQIYMHQGWLLILTFAILGLGLLYLYRNSPVRSA